MAAKITKSQSGLGIKFQKGKAIISWKKGETYTSQQLEYWWEETYKVNNKSVVRQSAIASRTLSGGTYQLVLGDSPAGLSKLTFRVKAKASGKNWSGWVSYSMKIYVPAKQELKAVWEDTAPNQTKFEWTKVETDIQPVTAVRYQTVLVENCPENYTADSLYSSATVQTATTSPITITESALTGSYARLVRMWADGPAGKSAYSYAYHVYSTPYKPADLDVVAEYNPQVGVFDATARWTLKQDLMQHPVDTTAILFKIGVPTANMGIPSGDWSEADTPVNTSNNYWQGQLGEALDNDECLFMSVRATHDKKNNQSDYVIPAKGKLKIPSAISTTPDAGTHTISVNVTNASTVPDAHLALIYEDPDTHEVSIMKVVEHGTAMPVNMIVPVWSDAPGKVGAYAFVGSYSATPARGDGVIVYNVEAVMTSDIKWSGTANAPSITVSKAADDTALIKWTWPWTDATNAELSWSDDPDAWTSNRQPETYTVSNLHASQWRITDLEQGKRYYFRVRLIMGDGDDAVYGVYSAVAMLDLTSAPEKPVLTLSKNVITLGEQIEASWLFSSTDGSTQSYAEIAEVSGMTYTVIASSETSPQTIVDGSIWESDTQHNLVVRVFSSSNRQSVWSDPVTVTVAEPLDCQITQTSLVEEDIEINPHTYTGDPATFNNSDGIKEITKAQVTLEPHQSGTPWQSSLQTKPYLFHACPDLGHSYNSEFDTLVGASAVVNQLVPLADKSGSRTLTSNTTMLSSIHDIKTPHVILVIAIAKISEGTTRLVVVGRKQDDSYTEIYSDYAGTSNTIIYAIGKIKEFSSGDGIIIRLFASDGSGKQVDWDNLQFFDLTEYFGASAIPDRAYTLESGTAGAGIAWLKSYGFFTKPYYPFNAGTLQSVLTTGKKCVGKNLFDDTDLRTGGGYWYAFSSGYTQRQSGVHLIKVKPSTKYTISKVRGELRVAIQEYANTSTTQADNPILGDSGWKTSTYTFTTSANTNYVWLTFSSPNYGYNISASDVQSCKFMFEESETATVYEPYVAHEYDLPGTELMGLYKLDANNNIYADGDTQTSEGEWTHKYGSYTFTGNEELTSLPSPYYDDRAYVFYLTGRAHNVNVIFPVGARSNATTMAEMVPNSYRGATDSTGIIFFYPNLPTTADAQAFLAGKTIIYELATPTTEATDPFQSPQIVDNWGTEEYIDGRTVELPVGHETRYADIYEITGTDEVNTHVRGINQWDEEWENGAINGSTGVPTTDATKIRTKNYINVFGGSIYYFKAPKTLGIRWYDADKNYINSPSAQQNTTATAPANACYLKFQVLETTTYNHDISINYPSTDYDYHAYVGDDYTTDLGETVYGGTADIVNGTGKKMPYYSSYNGETLTGEWLSDRDPYVAGTSPSIGAQVVNTGGELIDFTFTGQNVTPVQGENNVWSEQGEITVRTADAKERVHALKELPLTVTVTGAGDGGETVVKIVRSENYAMERPDGKDYAGYVGDLIVQKVQTGEAQLTINLSDLVGRLDDTARYDLIATVQDNLGQKAEAVINFVVDWTHQAVVATGSAVIDGNIAKITVTKPTGADDTDTVDIYRLSAGKPELLFEGAEFGKVYVDPYPTLGSMGGYRLCLLTANGDYITSDLTPSWTDLTAGLETKFQYIDFGDEQLELKFNVDLDASYSRPTTITHYLGGAIQGDTIEGTEMESGITGVIPYDLNPGDYATLVSLAEYGNACRVRTKAGRNYAALITVQDSLGYNEPGHPHSVSLKLNRVDSQGQDGVLLSEWEA